MNFKEEVNKIMTNFYTADLHFGTKSLLADGVYHERPFKTPEENDAELIKRWNAKVTNGDHVYILGDIGRRGFLEMHPECLCQLKGNKHLILGNHDDVSDLRIRQMFVEICNYKRIKDSGKTVILSHYPIIMWEGQHKGNILIYGHVHNTDDETLFRKYLDDYCNVRGETLQAFNAGVCWWNYEPVTLNEMLERGMPKMDNTGRHD